MTRRLHDSWEDEKVFDLPPPNPSIREDTTTFDNRLDVLKELELNWALEQLVDENLVETGYHESSVLYNSEGEETFIVNNSEAMDTPDA